MKNWFTNIIIVCILFTFVACNGFELVHDLNERDANEIIVLLAKNNISAKKQKEIRNQEIFWIVIVGSDDEIQSQSILVANHLPRVRQGGLKGICDEPGMIVTAKFEKCQEILALKGEIINALESVPGVVSADVVLNIPEKEEFPDENTPTSRPTAAVTVKYLSDANVKTNLSEGNVQDFVANTVDGLDARDVKVIISFFVQKMNGQTKTTVATTVDPNSIGTTTNPTPNGTVAAANGNLVSVGGIMMDEESAQKFKIISAVFLVLLLLLAAAFIFSLFRMSKMRKQASVTAETAPAESKEAEKKLLEA